MSIEKELGGAGGDGSWHIELETALILMGDLPGTA